MASIRSDDLILNLLVRLSLVVMWLTFFVFHLTVFVIALVVLWYLQISPESLLAQLSAFAQSVHVAIAGLFGASLVTVFLLWAKVWRKIYGAVITPYLFRDVDEYMRQQR